MQGYQAHTEVVLGMHLSINWQAGLIRPYALKPFAGMNYLSYAKAGMPYMG